MISYVMLGSNDLDRAAKFYDGLLAEFDAQCIVRNDRMIAWGKGDAPMLMVCTPFDGQQATAGNGTMIALAVDQDAQVDAIYRRAMELGATDEGKPGPRAEGRAYVAYFRDPDGNKLNIIHRY